MAIDINGGIQNAPIEEEPIQNPIDITPEVNDELPPISKQFGAKGLSPEEINEPNKIVVTIADQETPIVMLFGPPSCGKTMTLIRLTRYLQSQGYTIDPVRTFRPTYDTHYADLCDNFDQMINSNDAARSTDQISFLLVQVLKQGRPICQILEAPGEHYFMQDDPNNMFPAYINAIIASSCRKIWSIFVEPGWNDAIHRANYVTKITGLKSRMVPRDKTLFILNKIDKTHLVFAPGRVNMKQAIKQTQDLYPNIFTPFLNLNPITKLWKKYNCDLVPFQTGYYNQNTDGYLYVEGPVEYPKLLWGKILKLVNG